MYWKHFRNRFKMRLFSAVLVMYVVHCECRTSNRRNPDVFTIGGVLSNNESKFHFERIIAVTFISWCCPSISTAFRGNANFYILVLLQNINFVDTFVPRHNTYYPQVMIMDPNPIRTAWGVCNKLVSKRVNFLQYFHNSII